MAPMFNWVLQQLAGLAQGTANTVNYINAQIARVGLGSSRAAARTNLAGGAVTIDRQLQAATARRDTYAAGRGDFSNNNFGGRDSARLAAREQANIDRLTAERRAVEARLLAHDLETNKLNAPTAAPVPRFAAGGAAPTGAGGASGGKKKGDGVAGARGVASARGARSTPAARTPRRDEALADATRLLDSYERQVEKASEPTDQLSAALNGLAVAAAKIPARADDARAAAVFLSKEFIATAIEAKNFDTATNTILSDPAFGVAMAAATRSHADLAAQLRAGKITQQDFGRIVAADTEALLLQAEAADRAAQATARLVQEKSRVPEVDYRAQNEQMQDQADATYEAARRGGATVQESWRGANREMEQSNAALDLLLETSRQLPRTWEDFGQVALRVLTNIITKSAELTWGEGGTGGGFGGFLSKIGEAFGFGKGGGAGAGASGSGGGFAGFFKSIGSIFTKGTPPIAGARAMGGPVSAGRAYQVNEAGVRPVNPSKPDMEWFVPKIDGAIWNPQQMRNFSAQQNMMRAQGVGGGAPTVNVAPPQVNFILKNETGAPITSSQRKMPDGSMEVTLRKMLGPAVRAELADMGRDGTLGGIQNTSRKPVRRS
jgi:hypothetical protein